MRLLVLLVIPAALAAQGFIDNVAGPGGLAPGGFAVIEGAYFDRNTTVQIGGLPAAVLDFKKYFCDAPGCEVGLVVQLPTGLAPGNTSVILSSGDTFIADFPVAITPYAPALVPSVGSPLVGFVPQPRVERVLPTGAVAPWTCAGGTPLPGELVRIYASGLGATLPLIPTGQKAPSDSLAATVLRPGIMVGSNPAEVVESVLAPGELGIYRITFKVPDGNGSQTITLVATDKQIQMVLPVGATAQALPDQTLAAAESIQTVRACGGSFGPATQQLAGDPRIPPSTLGGVEVVVRDSQGAERQAPLLRLSSDQIEYITPVGTSTGTASVTVKTPDGATFRGSMEVQSIAPRVLEAAPGISAGYLVRVRNGVAGTEPIYLTDVDGSLKPIPIDLGPPDDQVYLTFFGTGWRSRTGTLDGVSLVFSRNDGAFLSSEAAIYAGAQGEYAGIDQINVLLPRFLAGSGSQYTVHTFVEVDGDRTGLSGLTYQ
jgi:uncharacterized protein (TIGR03437 family)